MSLAPMRVITASGSREPISRCICESCESSGRSPPGRDPEVRAGHPNGDAGTRAGKVQERDGGLEVCGVLEVFGCLCLERVGGAVAARVLPHRAAGGGGWNVGVTLGGGDRVPERDDQEVAHVSGRFAVVLPLCRGGHTSSWCLPGGTSTLHSHARGEGEALAVLPSTVN
jgi:hypothetical protein